MGSPAQQPVYYDAEQGQYYTMKPPEPSKYGGLTEEAKNSPEYANYLQRVRDTRNYLGNPYQQMQQQSAVPDYNYAPYAELTNLFPSLNESLMQNSPTSLLAPSDTQSFGAGRFLSSNTQGK